MHRDTCEVLVGLFAGLAVVCQICTALCYSMIIVLLHNDARHQRHLTLVWRLCRRHHIGRQPVDFELECPREVDEGEDCEP